MPDGIVGSFTMKDVQHAVDSDFLDAGRGVADGKGGWKMAPVSTPRGTSFEDAKMRCGCKCARARARVCVGVCACVCVCVSRMYACMCVCMYVCMHVHMYVCMSSMYVCVHV